MLWEFSALLSKRGKKHARTDVINRVAFLCISKEIPGPGYDAQEDNVRVEQRMVAQVSRRDGIDVPPSAVQPSLR